MLKKTIEYVDYNGTPRKEDFYFNLSEAEIMEMEYGTNGTFTEMMKQIIAAQDGATIMKTFKELILKSYGEKSLDGKHFTKSEALSEAFSHTEAYSKLYIELITDDNAASDFFNGIMPGNHTVTKEEAKQMVEELIPSATTEE